MRSNESHLWYSFSRFLYFDIGVSVYLFVTIHLTNDGAYDGAFWGKQRMVLAAKNIMVLPCYPRKIKYCQNIPKKALV